MKYTKEKDLSKNKYILYARKSTEAEDRQVASIESQIEVMQEVANEMGLNIIDIVHESASGYHIGREVFNHMLERILKGEANGIIAWKLSRLSRNPDDAGKIMGMLQRGNLQHIRTIDRNWFPEDNVMMMYVEFGVNNQFSRDLSADTHRGLIKKAERGWSPYASLPYGYVHSPYKKLGDKEILNDAERYKLVRHALKSVASSRMLPTEAYEYLYNNGFRSKRGKKIANSVWYRMLTNPFYYGEFEYPKGSNNWYSGKHQPMINKDEFESIQYILGRKDKPRPKKHFFPYVGLMKCGECGCSIVADPKMKIQKNGNIHKYVYYRCSKKKGLCSQRCTEVKVLEEQFREIINNIHIPEAFHEWAINELKKDHEQEIEERTANNQIIRKRYDECLNKIDSLVEGWLNKKVPEDIYDKKVTEYEEEKRKLKKIIDNIDLRVEEWLSKADQMMDFASKVKDKFEDGDDYVRKEIVNYLGLNLILKDRKLSLELKKPLGVLSSISNRVNVIASRFEPLKIPENKEQFMIYLSSNSEWGG